MTNRISKNDFIDLIKSKIDVQRYNAERSARIFKMIIIEILLALSLYGGFYFIKFLYMKDHALLVLLSGIVYFVLLILLFMMPSLLDKSFKEDLKEMCGKEVLKLFNLKTFNGGKIPNIELQKSGLFSTFNNYECDDIIIGEYNGIKYTVAEAELRDVRGSGKHKQDLQAFKGVIISFPFSKEIKAQTLVITKGDNNVRNYITGTRFKLIYILIISLIPICILLPITIKFVTTILRLNDISVWQIIWPIISASLPGDLIILFVIGYLVKNYLDKKKKMQDVHTEDLSFDKKFCVFGEDQIEARYLVTPSFMQRMKDLETSFGTKKIKCSFFNNKLMFAMSTNKDLFELGSLWHPIGKDIENFYDEITSIQEIINHFKLDKNIGL